MKKFSLFYFTVFFAIAVFAIILIMFPQETANATRSALSLCASSVIPALFPFFVVSRLITNLRYADAVKKIFDKLTKPLFSVSGSVSSALALGLLGGYPVGAHTCAELYKGRLCTKKEAERTLAFCNNCGPAFIMGAIGSGVFSSAKTGLLLLGIHILAALSVGIILRVFFPVNEEKINYNKNTELASISFSKAFTDAVLGSLNACLSISAYIVLFSVLTSAARLIRLLPAIGKLISLFSGLDVGAAEALIAGVLEMTVGAYSITQHANFDVSFVAIAFLLGWGGLSVHCQALSALAETDLDTKQYFFGKLLHGILSAIYAFLALLIFTPSAVSAFATSSVTQKAEAFPLYFIPVIIFIFIFCKKGWKKAK